MRGANRARVSASRLTAVIVAMLASLGVQGALVSAAGAAVTHGTATVTIEVNGLPRHAHGNVKLTRTRQAIAPSRPRPPSCRVSPPAPTPVTAQPVVSAGKSYRLGRRPVFGVRSMPGACTRAYHRQGAPACDGPRHIRGAQEGGNREPGITRRRRASPCAPRWRAEIQRRADGRPRSPSRRGGPQAQAMGVVS